MVSFGSLGNFLHVPIGTNLWWELWVVEALFIMCFISLKSVLISSGDDVSIAVRVLLTEGRKDPVPQAPTVSWSRSASEPEFKERLSIVLV